ncbi:pseudouridine synthase [Methylocystis sp. B8]|uniref:pseudouridine synthase n=1 Tax=Methylocystis sp. B8 TaxID=544938 RepID=UPI0010FE175F|nr:pseudouridine synthase [Methylocystis sp. B8]TLG75689.1 pseudouridine synthase [Methylocystis sp. B8]
MTEKNRNTRSGSAGGDRPLRRRARETPALHAVGREDARPAKPRSDKPRFDKPRFDKPASRDSESARAKYPAKKRGAAPEPAPHDKAFEGDRIAKVMARAGVCSRRDAERWIAEGRVAVNGRALTSPAFNVRESDKITIDGAPMQARERTRLFLFHKPAGFVTTARDEEGRPTVFSYLEERHTDLPRLVSVGRLDINTEGLLLLTNDGGLARTLELPATGWTRRYRVRAHGAIDQAQLDSLRHGVTIEGVNYAPIEARLERTQGANAWIAMSLTEGKNREIKRVMAHLGLDVTRLIRVSYGPFQLGDLAEGVVEEVRLKTLREQLGKSLAELAGADFAAPLREKTPAEQQEIRERAEKRSRKHFSTLRKERDEGRDVGPRARVTRGAVADRKGRAVAVERVTPVQRKAQEESLSRNARRFESMRGERPTRGERFVRDETRRDERQPTQARRSPPQWEEPRSERPTRRRQTTRGEEAPRHEQRFERRSDRGKPRDLGAHHEAAHFESASPRRDRAAGRDGAERQGHEPKFDKTRSKHKFSAHNKSSGPRASRGEDGARSQRKGDASTGPRKTPRTGPARGGAGAPRKGPRKPRGA